MQCKNCGAVIHEGDSFCRTCAVPVNINPNSGLTDISNPATNAFMINDSTMPQQQEPIYKDENFQSISAPQESIPDEEANKNFIKRDGNDRVTATVRNVLGLVILLVIIVIIGFLLYEKVFKNIF